MGYGATVGKERDYEAENDARDLIRAHEIMADKKRMKKAMPHIEKGHAAHAMILGYTEKDRTAKSTERAEDAVGAPEKYKGIGETY